MINVCFEYWTDQDAEIGDTDNRGFLAENVSLRDAFEFISQDMGQATVYGVGTSSYPAMKGDWITIDCGRDWSEDSAPHKSYSIHVGDAVSVSSLKRIIKAFNS